MRIVAVNGSFREELSVNNLIIDKLIQEFKKKCEVSFQKIDFNDINVNPCKGMMNCFKHGECLQKDDFEFIKKSLDDSDIIIIASPIYSLNVSGQLKTLIDRLSYCTHTMEFIGKFGITTTSSTSSGNKEVTEYLEGIMTHLGIINIGNVNYNQMIMFENLDFKKIVEDFFYTINGKGIDEFLEKNTLIHQRNFNFFKSFYLSESFPEIRKKEYEYSYWRRNYYKNLNFIDYFKSNCKLLK